MSTDITQISKLAQEQVLSTIQAGQDALLDGLRQTVESISSVTPDTLKSINVPGVEALPQPADITAMTFDFGQQLLAAQRNFAEELVSIVSPAPAKGARTKAAAAK